ncbi:CidA/LrgA family protein [Clostridium ganghwense]|uniref:CidA/LrgA family protein n=1 Tax=Clostridium ganghwense TaxID=312089 RepID=A0ABT4CQA3_9CLOT|nr:CidA/LrgA family protein [Clostridium ganghwense]MCY6370261.1 CidA/LrgA family protein [Clostridium ganghwense]
MKLLRQSSIILIIWFSGELLHTTLNLPIPGSVLGMLILLTCLCTRVIKLDMIEEFSNFLLDHLAFFFIPAGVGLISCFPILKDNWIAIIAISFFSTIIIMSSTGIIVQSMIRRRNK